MTESFVTLATDNISCLGCLVLCNSLKQSGTDKLISILVNPTVSFHLRSILQKSFDKVYYTLDLCVPSDSGSRLDVHGEYERLKCWLLTDFNKCVFLESDVLVVENIDDLFDRMELSASSDPKWPDCFDAGVFVLEPSVNTYSQLVNYSITNPIVDNSFQCLLNMFFSDWNVISMERKIPFIYNCQINSTFYTHTTALIHFGHSIKAARLGNSVFASLQSGQHMSTTNNETLENLWSKWWRIFNETVKPAVDANDTLHFKRTGCDYGSQSAQPLMNPKEESSFQSQSSLELKDEPSFPGHNPLKTNEETLVTPEAGPPVTLESKFPIERQAIQNQESMFPNQESSCPSQHLFDSCHLCTSYSNQIIQVISEEKSCTTTTDTLVVSTTEGDISDMDDDDNDGARIIERTPMNTEEMERDHRLRWERGEIDYMGEDSFDNILAKLSVSLVASSDEGDVVSTEE